MKEFADDNFKFDENGREFSIRVENTVGKRGKLLVCFEKNCSADLFGKELVHFAKKSTILPDMGRIFSLSPTFLLVM